MLVATDERVYDEKGNYVGHRVAEIPAFTEAELRPVQCSECGGANGHHREYFIKTGQHGGGEVYGHYQMCSRAATDY